MASRYYSSHVDYAALQERFRPIAEIIGKLQLHTENDPSKLDEYVQKGLISKHTSDFFKKEIAEREKAQKTVNRQKNLFYYIGIPLIFLTAWNAYLREEEDHLSHELNHQERVNYPYLYRLARKLPFGNGNHTLFHNPDVNYDPYAKKDH